MVPDGAHVQSLPKTMLNEDLIQRINKYLPKELKRLPKKVAPGIDGMRYEHIAYLASNDET
eukprot:2371782-Amphidinium_carterae.1